MIRKLEKDSILINLQNVLNMLKNILGVYFDFFGTLIDSRYAITNVWSQIAKKFGIEISPDDEFIRKGVLKQFAAYDKLKEKYDRMGEPWVGPSNEEMQKLNKIVLDTMGVDIKGSKIIIEEEFKQKFRTGKVFRLNPGCRDTLEKISSREIKLGILANGSSQHGKKLLDRLGILDFFKIFIFAADLGYTKSQIEVYQIAFEAMKTENPEHIVHVGDDLHMDVEMAQKIGMIPILLDPYNESSLDNVITITELPELLHYLPLQ